MKDNYGLLIASLVAIVAIVGLVILFNGATTGAVPHTSSDDGAAGYSLGGTIAKVWNPAYGDQNQYCSTRCGEACASAQAGGAVALVGECYNNCASTCKRAAYEEALYRR